MLNVQKYFTAIITPLLLLFGFLILLEFYSASHSMASDNMQSWSVQQITTQEGGPELRIMHDNSQYATLHLRDSYFRMVYSPESNWATSVILLPSFWSEVTLFQGAPVTATWKTVEPNLLLTITGTIASLTTSINLTLTPPSNNSITAHVVATIISGTVTIDGRPGEGFKPVMLSSMHVSAEQWDTEAADVNEQNVQIPMSGWLVTPTVVSKVFGLLGGTSSWKTNAPTFKVELNQPFQITGWVTASENPNDDNVGLWAASDGVLAEWSYTVSASERIWGNYLPVVLNQPTPTPTATNTPTPTPSPTPWSYKREAENPSTSTVGKKINRTNACQKRVHGQFGTEDIPGFPSKAGLVEYADIDIPETDVLYFKMRYSKNSSSSTPIEIYIDDNLRTSFRPFDQVNWNGFSCTEAIDLGSVTGGKHKLTLRTAGQRFGVADLDKFELSNQSDLWSTCTCE